MTLREAIAEPFRATNSPDLVMRTPDLLARRSHEVSDGQLQRACLTRARALDASTTAVPVGVVQGHQREAGAGVLAISHDSVLLDRWTDHTLLLEDGHHKSRPTSDASPAER